MDWVFDAAGKDWHLKGATADGDQPGFAAYRRDSVRTGYTRSRFCVLLLCRVLFQQQNRRRPARRGVFSCQFGSTSTRLKSLISGTGPHRETVAAANTGPRGIRLNRGSEPRERGEGGYRDAVGSSRDSSSLVGPLKVRGMTHTWLTRPIARRMPVV